MRLAVLSAVFAFAAAAATPVTPKGVKPIGPYTPGMMTRDFLYVSGQGARDAAGNLPAAFDAQVRQTLDNVKAVVEAAKLSLAHVVFVHVYLEDVKNYDAFNRVYAEYFPKEPPARATIAVLKMPGGTPVEVSAVAVRDLKTRKAIGYEGRKMPVPLSPAIQAGDRVFLTGGLGRVFETGEIPKTPREQMKILIDAAASVLKGAGLELRHLAHVNIYVTQDLPMKLLADALQEFLPSETATTIIQTAALPFGAKLQMSGVASRQMKRLGNCTGVGDTLYCAARSGTIRQALESLKRDLEANKLSLGHAVASNVFMDDIAEFAAMNQVYAGFFGKIPPTRTTVQPAKRVADLNLPPATDVATVPDNSPRAQVAIIVSSR